MDVQNRIRELYRCISLLISTKDFGLTTHEGNKLIASMVVYKTNIMLKICSRKDSKLTPTIFA
jgi:hypothetical protein